MNTAQRERFEQHRRDEDQYWDAMNDKRYERCVEIERSMDFNLRNDGPEKEQYKSWLRVEEQREQAKKEVDARYDQEIGRINRYFDGQLNK